MLTHFVRSINWVDVALFALLARVVFVGVQGGFVAEFFKILGVLTAVFVSLNYYTVLAAKLAGHATVNPGVWEFICFVALWSAAVFVWRLLRQGVSMLFKVQTNHQGFDKYAGGALAAGRGILLCSLTIFALLLTTHPYLSRLTLKSIGYKVAGMSAVNTYAFVHHNLVAKLVEGQTYNNAVTAVVHGDFK